MQKIFGRTPAVVSILTLLLATSSAKAACGMPERASEIIAGVSFAAQSAVQDSMPTGEQDHDHGGSILGLWHATYVNENNIPGFESFKFWHPDGTEWESSNLDSVCLGVWRETKAGTVRLHHIAWTFANGILTGTLTIDEIDSVAPDSRTYTGMHTVTFYDLNGNVLQQFKGTQTAKRITVDSIGAP